MKSVAIRVILERLYQLQQNTVASGHPGNVKICKHNLGHIKASQNERINGYFCGLIIEFLCGLILKVMSLTILNVNSYIDDIFEKCSCAKI